jgi:hypothetical protein
MPIVPLRELGKLGVITDVDPFDLPIHAFSFAKNVRFEDGKVERGSVFRRMGALDVVPSYLLSWSNQNNVAVNLVVASDGRVRHYDSDGVTSDLSPASWPGAVAPSSPVTSCVLQNMVYINRPDHVPWALSKDYVTGTKFAEIPTATSGTAQWHTDWRCRSLRAMNGSLIAFNVTKGSISYPNMVKWSNFPNETNITPPDWDYFSTTSNAGENTLAELRGSIMDALLLRNRMYIYGDQETWLMEFLGGDNMFSFQRAYDRDVIGTNCVAEVNGIHYVFGNDDLWMHDGTQDKPLATGRVRKFIYGSIRKSKAYLCFVTHNKRTNEVIFCYSSDDPYCKFPASGGEGCNRAVHYNYVSDTFYFSDLPYVTGAAHLKPTATGAGYDTFTGSYESVGGSFAAQEVETKLNLTMASVASTSLQAALRTFEPYNESSSTFDLDSPANASAFLLREGVDADELQAELRGYKLISSIYPQGRLDSDAQAIIFTFGTADYVTDAPEYGVSQTWDRTYYKLDFNQAGRFLAYRVEQTDFKTFSFSGFDFDITLLGRY